MNQTEVKTNVVFKHLENSDKRITIEQGGTRSGKTYNVLLWIILGYCTRNTGKIVTIARKSYPALRASSMRDFFTIMQDLGLYSEADHNKTNSEYHFNGNLIEFISLDQPQKVRGRKRDVLFLNEANEASLEDWRQLIFRTNEKIIIDFNPSFEFHWIFDHVKGREDSDFYRTTYRDNPFLNEGIISEIERLEGIDEWYWKVYGLGEAAASQEIIYRYEPIEYSSLKDKSPIVYGMDFGYTNNPSSLVAVYQMKDGFAIDEVFYEKGMTNRDIALKCKELGVIGTDTIYADSAEPKSIDEIYDYGLNIMKSQKEVKPGISYIQQQKLYCTTRSLNLLKELRNYKWKKDKNDIVLNEPVKMYDHGMDAMRYAIYTMFGNQSYGSYHIR